MVISSGGPEDPDGDREQERSDEESSPEADDAPFKTRDGGDARTDLPDFK